MSLILLSLLIFFAGGAAMSLLPGRSRVIPHLGPLTAAAAAIPGFVAAIVILGGGSPASVSLPWSIPSGSLSLAMDRLSALFAAPVLFVTALAAIYGWGYMRGHGGGGRSTARFWAFYNLLGGSMLLVVTAANALLFLVGWEVMALSSFFLVMHEHGEGSVRRAGWIYLVASHAGAACLLLLFSLLGKEGGTLEFAGMALPGGSGAADFAFLLALVGFGSKAGFVPLHVWLPEAHPAAPSNVSAVMSGVMIKTGIYGILRFLPCLGAPPEWWGWTLLAVGIASGIVGVLSALAQHDLKRLLAYHSVENIGIIAAGLGLGLLGISRDIPMMAFLGFAGGLLHMVNHAVFKSLLFMSAGAVARETATREIDNLGGLLRRMPRTGACFFTGSAAICGLPPMNGFVSELLIYLAALAGLTSGGSSLSPATAGLITAGGLALIGGLALACFTKAFGIVFLGEPRSRGAAAAGEVTAFMWVPASILAVTCLVLGLAGPLLLDVLRPVVADVCSALGYALPGAAPFLDGGGVLGPVSIAFAALIAGGLVLLGARRLLMRRRSGGPVPTWDCGFEEPAASMQYTASSFADPIVRLFGGLLRTRRTFSAPAGLFPQKASFSSETPDIYHEKLYRPAFRGLERFFSRFRVIQHGRVNLYILYIVAALVALLAWKLA